MGCLISLLKLDSTFTPNNLPNKPFTSLETKRPRPDPKDFEFSKCIETTKIKLPGSLGSEIPFQIEDCTKCIIFICDNSAQVTIDNCIDCFIFIGPCEGSLFIR